MIKPTSPNVVSDENEQPAVYLSNKSEENSSKNNSLFKAVDAATNNNTNNQKVSIDHQQRPFQSPFEYRSENSIGQMGPPPKQDSIQLSADQDDQSEALDYSFIHNQNDAQQQSSHQMSRDEQIDISFIPDGQPEEVQQQFLVLRQLNEVRRRLELCQILFQILSAYFGLLLLCSIIEQFLIWTQIDDGGDWFVILSIFQNTFHTYFFAIGMLKLVVKKLQQMQSPVLSMIFLNEILLHYSDLGVTSILYYLIKKRIQLFQTNQTLFTLMFIFGCFKLFQPNNQVQEWYMVVELCLGFLIFGVLFTSMTAVCFIVPFTLCFSYRFNRRRSDLDNPDEFDYYQEEDSHHIQLPDPVIFSSQNAQNIQPCYICLQEYQQEEMVIELPCLAKHMFHQECIQPWVELHPHCPVCRQSFE